MRKAFVQAPCNTVAFYLPELLLRLLEVHFTKITALICGNHKFYIHKGQTCVEHALLPFPFEPSDVDVKIKVSIGSAFFKKK